MTSPIEVGSSSFPSHLLLQGHLEHQNKCVTRPVEYLGDKAVTLEKSFPSRPLDSDVRADQSDQSNEAMVRISNEWFKNEQLNIQFPLLLEEFASTVPVVAETVEALSREFWNVPYGLPIQKAFGESEDTGHGGDLICDSNPGRVAETLPIVLPARTLAGSVGPVSQRRYKFTCIQCKRTHDRFSRARDCQYQDLGLTPYKCGGACGDTICTAAYSSEERWRRHLGPTIRCQICQKEISSQNVARHRDLHSPSHQGKVK